MVGASLGLMPVWSWVAYSLFFAPLNKASHAVVALFVVQDLRFAYAALLRSDLAFHS